MGLRGPAPKPTVIKEASGNPGRRQLNEHEPIPPAGEVVAPSWLSKDARKIWDDVAPVCLAMRTLTVADVGAFARYCEFFARWIKYKEALWDKGVGATTYKAEGSNHVLELPQSHDMKRLAQLLKEMEDRFGLTPGSRSRLRVERIQPTLTAPSAGGPARKDGGPIPIAEFMRGGGPKPQGKDGAGKAS